MRVLQDLLMFIGRVLLAFVFTYSAVDQLTHWEATVALYSIREIPYPALVAGIGVVLQLVGALALFFGMKTRLGAFLLMVYVIGSTLILHNILTLSQPGNEAQLLPIIQSIGTLAALCYILAAGAGRLSGDVFAGRKKTYPVTVVPQQPRPVARPATPPPPRPATPPPPPPRPAGPPPPPPAGGAAPRR